MKATLSARLLVIASCSPNNNASNDIMALTNAAGNCSWVLNATNFTEVSKSFSKLVLSHSSLRNMS